ncbi:MAG: hypothetical protein RJA76_856 [Bacteroidota bacterium]|jgi:hypothetical protein
MILKYEFKVTNFFAENGEIFLFQSNYCMETLKIEKILVNCRDLQQEEGF